MRAPPAVHRLRTDLLGHCHHRRPLATPEPARHRRHRGTAPVTGPLTPRQNPKSGTVKLRPGQLRAHVLTILHSAPHKQWRPKEVCDTLPGRSSGAIGQALDKLVELGQATATGAPSRYTATTGTGTPAPTPPPPTPATPKLPQRVGPVTRPNGAPYHPRSLGGRADV